MFCCLKLNIQQKKKLIIFFFFYLSHRQLYKSSSIVRKMVNSAEQNIHSQVTLQQLLQKMDENTQLIQQNIQQTEKGFREIEKIHRDIEIHYQDICEISNRILDKIKASHNMNVSNKSDTNL